MKCPVDGSTLSAGERGGIEVAQCPQCRGAWLDRGELDTLLDRAAGQTDRAPASPTVASDYERERDERLRRTQQQYADPERYASSPPPRRPPRKQGWLGRIFD